MINLSDVINGEERNDGGMEFGKIFDYRDIDGIGIEKVGEGGGIC